MGDAGPSTVKVQLFTAKGEVVATVEIGPDVLRPTPPVLALDGAYFSYQAGRYVEAEVIQVKRV